jgi:hypothetical protein
VKYDGIALESSDDVQANLLLHKTIFLVLSSHRRRSCRLLIRKIVIVFAYAVVTRKE